MFPVFSVSLIEVKILSSILDADFISTDLKPTLYPIRPPAIYVLFPPIAALLIISEPI